MDDPSRVKKLYAKEDLQDKESIAYVRACVHEQLKEPGVRKICKTHA